MARIQAVLACGCRVHVDEAAAPSDRVDPICPTHGEARVVRVTAPPPRFRGMAHGPCAQFDPTIGAK